LKQARSGGKVWGNSGVCLSGAKRSEFSRGPNFSEHHSEPRRGWFIWGALFRFLFGQAKRNKKIVLSSVESKYFVEMKRTAKLAGLLITVVRFFKPGLLLEPFIGLFDLLPGLIQ
jgi:hypothetical protein